MSGKVVLPGKIGNGIPFLARVTYVKRLHEGTLLPKARVEVLSPLVKTGNRPRDRGKIFTRTFSREQSE